MTEHPPITVSEPEWERGLWWMVLASGGLHLVALALLLVIPHSFLHRSPPLQSYTVDLIAPDRIGGNNLIPGGKSRVVGAPPAPKVEPPKPAPEQVAKKPEPQPEPPKTEQKPEENDVVLAEKVKKVEPSPVPTGAKPTPSPQVKPAPSPNVVANAELVKPQPPAQPTVDTKAAKEVKEVTAARERDERIGAAVRRMQQQTGTRGGGSGKQNGEQPGGPMSVGPGEGAGGAVKGVEYLLYYNQMINRIKQSWAWAGANRLLEAAVRFHITETGEVVDVRITQPSGDPSYDASVGRAVRAANPLAPPPEAYRKEFSEVELTFRPDDLRM